MGSYVHGTKMLVLWYPIQHSLGLRNLTMGQQGNKKRQTYRRPQEHTGRKAGVSRSRVDSDPGQLLYKDPEPQHIYYVP